MHSKPQKVVRFAFCSLLFSALLRDASQQAGATQERSTCVPVHILITTTISSAQQTDHWKRWAGCALTCTGYIWLKSANSTMYVIGQVTASRWTIIIVLLYAFAPLPWNEIIYCTTNMWQSLTRFNFNYSCRGSEQTKPEMRRTQADPFALNSFRWKRVSGCWADRVSALLFYWNSLRHQNGDESDPNTVNNIRSSAKTTSIQTWMERFKMSIFSYSACL